MASSTLNIGQELHGESTVYRIESVLGQGSFGITYKAKAFTVMKGKFGEELVESSRPKAIKEFFMKEVNERDASGSITGMSEGSLSYNYAQKFKKEAENLASMNHPNIVKVIDFISANNTYYYVMDYIEGENLNDYLKSHKMSEEEATNTIIEVAKALKYMHEEKHMLHLDLKPGNIMRRSSDGHIFLIDFGLSKHYSDDGMPETSTSIGLGTAGYAPIEQSHQSKTGVFRPTVDVYALGATFYKLLTGQTPPYASEMLPKGEIAKNELSKYGINDTLISAVVHAMYPLCDERTQNIADFIESLKTGVAKKNQKKIESKTNITVASTNKENTILDVPKKKLSKKDLPIKPAEGKSKRRKETSGKSREKVTEKPAKDNVFFREWGIRCGRYYISFGNTLTILFLIALYIFIFWQNGIWPFSHQKEGVKENSGENVVSNPESATTSSAPSKTFTVSGVNFKMICVEGGTFQMGSNDGVPDERPVHGVTLSSYYIGQTEVTQELWQAVMGSNPSASKRLVKPVEHVSWEECQTFISKLNQLTGQKFRLPTEAEWEYAARGGEQSKGYKYSGSNTLADVAWYRDNSSSKTHPVATKLPNELGLYDMSGNVWEWCQDWYDENYYKKSPSNNPTGPTSGSCRVLRSSSYGSGADGCSSVRRDLFPPSSRNTGLGLRLAL